MSRLSLQLFQNRKIYHAFLAASASNFSRSSVARLAYLTRRHSARYAARVSYSCNF